MTINVTFRDLVLVIIAIVCTFNSQLFNSEYVPKRLRWCPWLITIISIILLIMSFTGHIPTDILFTIGSKK